MVTHLGSSWETGGWSGAGPSVCSGASSLVVSGAEGGPGGQEAVVRIPGFGGAPDAVHGPCFRTVLETVTEPGAELLRREAATWVWGPPGVSADLR